MKEQVAVKLPILAGKYLAGQPQYLLRLFHISKRSLAPSHLRKPPAELCANQRPNCCACGDLAFDRSKQLVEIGKKLRIGGA